MSRRFDVAAGRGNALLVALTEEYVACFENLATTYERHKTLLLCMNDAIELAFATIVPMFLESALREIDTMHPVTIKVCRVFFIRLQKSWFALENSNVNLVCKHLHEPRSDGQWSEVCP